MTDEERTKLQRDTVARIHAARGRRPHGANPTTRGRVAARYAALCNVSITEAARAVGIDRSWARKSWITLYPGVTPPRGTR